jgi:uncharacterized protein YdeI (YjbR/CyaY-like superfamily)
MMKPSELPVLSFENKKKWLEWLAKQHDKLAGVWLKLAKKDSRIPSITYEEALDVALCYGWIDGQKKGFDDKYWLQKFTPRGPKSIWSKINTEKAERLIVSGEMKPSGLKAVEAAKQDGRWEAAYSSQKNISVPEDLQAALNKNKKPGFHNSEQCQSLCYLVPDHDRQKTGNACKTYSAICGNAGARREAISVGKF